MLETPFQADNERSSGSLDAVWESLEGEGVVQKGTKRTRAILRRGNRSSVGVYRITDYSRDTLFISSRRRGVNQLNRKEII